MTVRDQGLRIAPAVQDCHLVHAAHGAEMGAFLFGPVFPLDVGLGVTLQGDARVPALLRAVMDQPFFANVQVPGAGTASPFVGLAVHKILLKIIDPGAATARRRLR